MLIDERALSTGAVVGIVVGVVVSVVVPVTIVAVLLGGGFGGGGSLATPQDTITTVYNAINAYDADTVYNCMSFSLQSIMPLDNVRAGLQAFQNMSATVSNLQISNVNITNDIATLVASGTLTYTYEGQPYTEVLYENYQLVKEDGMWKIDSFVLLPTT